MPVDGKPNFTGVWRVVRGDNREFILIQQKEADVAFVEFAQGRPFTLKAAINGQPQRQTLNGAPCEPLAKWDNDDLHFEVKPGAGGTHVRYILRLAAGGETASVYRTTFAITPATFIEKWERQDGPELQPAVNGFELLRARVNPGPPKSLLEKHLETGKLGYAFNDIPLAEREFTTIIREEGNSTLKGDERSVYDHARELLTRLYLRNGMIKKASLYSTALNRSFLGKFAKYPEAVVLHRGYARIPYTRDPGGHFILPVMAAGKSVDMLVDNGAFNTLIRASEARRLGLKLRSLTWGTRTYVKESMPMQLAIVPRLKVGATTLRDVPFWVVPDEQLERPGVLGLNILLKLETIRFAQDGFAETGFASEDIDYEKANLSFDEDSFMLTEVSTNGQPPAPFVLDLGAENTLLFARFSMRFFDLISANSKLGATSLTAMGADRTFGSVRLQEVTLRLFCNELVDGQVIVFLEKTIMQYEGTIAIDVINKAQRVTMDLRAMRLVLE